MSIYVKICGLSTSEQVAAAVEAGAQGIGFVFSPSIRQITLDQALELLEPVRHCVESVAVMRHPEPQEVGLILRELRPTYLQTDVDDLKSLSLDNDVSLLPVFRSNVSDKTLWDKLKLITRDPILFEGGKSGAGEVANWKLAAEVARQRQIVLAGGLKWDNVQLALEQVHPWGVDVSSGVESSPGIKDPQKIVQFIEMVGEYGGDKG